MVGQFPRNLKWFIRRKGGSAWITSNLWSRRSPNFWTLLDSSTLFSLVKLVFSSASICPLTEMPDGHNLARYCKRKAIRPGFETISYIATCRVCSTRMLLDSCAVRVCHNRARRAKKAQCWQQDEAVLCISKRSASNEKSSFHTKL